MLKLDIMNKKERVLISPNTAIKGLIIIVVAMFIYGFWGENKIDQKDRVVGERIKSLTCNQSVSFSESTHGYLWDKLQRQATKIGGVVYNIWPNTDGSFDMVMHDATIQHDTTNYYKLVVTTEKRSSDSIKFLKITMVCSRCSHL